MNDFEKNSADRKEKPELEDIFNKYTNDYGNNYDKDKAQKNIEIERYAFRKLHEKGLENTNIERLLDITISESKTLYDIKLSRPRQHGHLKRKDSIRFLVFLDFSLIFIRSG